jgi:hypothetical protein
MPLVWHYVLCVWALYCSLKPTKEATPELFGNTIAHQLLCCEASQPKQAKGIVNNSSAIVDPQLDGLGFG